MRLFFAVDLPEEVKAEIERAREALRLDPRSWRTVRAARMHVTLRFLGEVEEGRLPALSTLAHEATAEVRPFACAVSGMGVFPGGRRARIVWAGLQDLSPPGNLARLAARIERGVREIGLPAEERPFAPHITLARARVPQAWTPPAESSLLARFDVSEIVLYRSRPGPGGSVYDVVSAVALG